MLDTQKMSAKALKEHMLGVPFEEYSDYVEVLNKDTRKAVLAISNQYAKKIKAHDDELNRIHGLWQFEDDLASDYVWVAGIDEAGRGPLAGPVVAAAVILPKHIELLGVNDSKKIPEAKREYLFDEIKKQAISVGVGIVDNDVIDDINILNATKLAMKMAVEQLEPQPEILLIDAVQLADISIKQESIIKGDAKSISIAAASIIAKVTRDRMIKEYDEKYPQYGFASHKGYGTKQHTDAIRAYGPTEFHRKTFISSFVTK